MERVRELKQTLPRRMDFDDVPLKPARVFKEINEFFTTVLARRDAVASGSISEGSEAGVTVVEHEVAEEDFVRHSG